MSEEKVIAAEGCTLAPEDIKRVKGLGFLHQKGTNKFNGRVLTRNGKITAAEAEAITEAAKKYGDGSMMFTTRLTVEVSGIDYENIDAFMECVGKAGLATGGTGALVRHVVACKGTTCQYGNYDTYALGEEVHERFYIGYHKVALPHKFKIAVGGCPNNCVKPNINDLGIVGARIPLFDEAKCKGCKKCKIEAGCPMKASKVKDGKLSIDAELCNDCGRCAGKCPFGAMDEGTYGWKMYIGGMWGKRATHGKLLDKFFTDKAELLDTVEKAILFFKSEGIAGERFSDTISRVGFEKAQAEILSDRLLGEKEAIIARPVNAKE